MKYSFIMLLTLLTSAPLLASAYEPYCSIEDGDAVAYLRNNTSSSVKVSGDIHFYFYDADRDLFWETSTPKHARISARSVGEVGSYGAPDDAEYCSVDMSDALDMPIDRSYSTFCELEDDGEAVGYLTNESCDTIRISGPVTFTWYDEGGDRIWDTTTPKRTSIRSGETDKIGSYNGPDRAHSCSIDVSEAID